MIVAAIPPASPNTLPANASTLAGSMVLAGVVWGCWACVWLLLTVSSVMFVSSPGDISRRSPRPVSHHQHAARTLEGTSCPDTDLRAGWYGDPGSGEYGGCERVA